MTNASSEPAGEMCQLEVDVVTTSKPVAGFERHLYRAAADIRISEGAAHKVYKADLAIRHPAGWMGVRAGFSYSLDGREYPTFEDRAEQAFRLALSEFPSGEHQIISVFLLGTGATDFADQQSAGRR